MGARAEALQELKRSWEGHVHLKELRSLAKAGPAAVREYAVSSCCGLSSGTGLPTLSNTSYFPHEDCWRPSRSPRAICTRVFALPEAIRRRDRHEYTSPLSVSTHATHVASYITSTR